MKHLKLAVFRLQDLDDVTRFRLMNAFFVAIAIGVMGPALITLKGTLMIPWVIAVFSILHQLTAKTNEYLSSFDIGTVYRMSAILNVLILLVTLTYFWSPLVMVYLESTLAIMEWAVISAFTIQLNNYIAKKHPESMHLFQLRRNNIWMDGSLLGLLGATLIMIPFHITGAILLFLVVQVLFTLWLLRNWNFFEGREG